MDSKIFYHLYKGLFLVGDFIMNIKNSEENRITQLEDKITHLETDLQAHYCQIGKEILELAENKQEEINNLVDRIIELKKKLAVIKKEIECPWCMTFNPSDSKCCKNCGEVLDTVGRKEIVR